MPAGFVKFAKRICWSLLRIFVATTVVIVLLLLFFQSKLIYHPRPYGPGVVERNPAIVSLEYTTRQGAQKAFYLPPRALPLRRLWVLFPGNGSLALQWLGFVKPHPDSHDGFLLIDYPGYGDCKGTPSPASIEESSEAAFNQLAQSLHTEPAALDQHLNVMGLSLGCATGLNFAVNHPVERMILIAPFTSMHDMARRLVGWPLCLLLRHNYDNRARLRQLAARPHPPRVDIFHGDADGTIPFFMGRELAGMFPQMITFHPVAGAGHNDVLSEAQPDIYALMRSNPLY